MQEHFLGFAQRAAMELIREKEREETSKLRSCFVKGPLLLCFFLWHFYCLCQTTGCPQTLCLRDNTVFKGLRRWKNCSRLWPGRGGSPVCSAGSAQSFLLSSPSWCSEKLAWRLLTFTKGRETGRGSAAIHEHGVLLLTPGLKDQVLLGYLNFNKIKSLYFQVCFVSTFSFVMKVPEYTIRNLKIQIISSLWFLCLFSFLFHMHRLWMSQTKGTSESDQFFQKKSKSTSHPWTIWYLVAAQWWGCRAASSVAWLKWKIESNFTLNQLKTKQGLNWKI